MNEIVFTYASKVKLNDFGTPFSIKFNEGPDEFNFSECQCDFFAKHQTIPDKNFTGHCVVDINNLTVTYFTVTGDNNELGSYKFEFTFSRDPELLKIGETPVEYHLTYPADKVLTYLVVENFEV